MSLRRPFTRGGRHLTVVRPRPFVPPPQVVQLWHLARRPEAGVALVLRSDPSLLWMGGALALVPVACLLWLTTAVVFHLGARILGGHQGNFRPTLQVTGIAMYAYAGLHLGTYVFRLTTPNAGHVVVALWLMAVLYQVGRQVYSLPAVAAAATAALPVLAVGIGAVI